jgi:hypothetical protein
MQVRLKRAIPQAANHLDWTVDYATSKAVARTVLGLIHVSCVTGTAVMELPWSPRKFDVYSFVDSATVPPGVASELTAQMLFLMRCAEQEYATQLQRSDTHGLLWEVFRKDGDDTFYKTKTPFGDIYIGYTAKEGEPLGDIFSVSTPWGSGLSALYLGENRRDAVFNHSTARIREGFKPSDEEQTEQTEVEKKTERFSLDRVLRQVENIYVATIDAEYVAVTAGCKKVGTPFRLDDILSLESGVIVESNLDTVQDTDENSDGNSESESSGKTVTRSTPPESREDRLLRQKLEAKEKGLRRCNLTAR